MAYPRDTAGEGTQGPPAALWVRAHEFIAIDSVVSEGLLLYEAVVVWKSLEQLLLPQFPPGGTFCFEATHILCEDVNIW